MYPYLMSEQEFSKWYVGSTMGHGMAMAGITVAVYLVLMLILVGDGTFYSLGVYVMGALAYFFGPKLFPKHKKEEIKRAFDEDVATINAERIHAESMYPALRDQLYAFVEEMRDPHACCIPQYYWDVAGVLPHYLQVGRAKDLTSAIQEYERDRKSEREANIMSQTLSAAREAQRISAQAAEHAYEAKMAAQNAEWMSFLTYLKR